ncbi:hypothetical protein PanWU01x14_310140 [Parasponia andersonii]|uniref:Uncharacterized protein n=1 Tax=Parasponia andersonii TaxID=3476 RepID=A0A2P5AQC9_PARAD|nr:hypothetical protein PanWU01x14_310140 [Parasponia andersonii]
MGSYTVKTEYWFAASLGDHASSSNPSIIESWWKRFLSLSLPAKVKRFALQAYNNALSVAVGFHQWKILAFASCCPPGKLLVLHYLHVSMRGRVKAALSKRLYGLLSAKDMEAKASRLGLCWAKDTRLPLQVVNLNSINNLWRPP